MKTKSYNSNYNASSNASNEDGDTFMTEFDVENDFAFLNDLQGIIRDTGLLKTCVTGCFGDDNTLPEGVCTVNDNDNNDSNNINNNYGYGNGCGYVKNKKGVTTTSKTTTIQSRTQSAMSAVSSMFMPELVPSSDTSASDDEYCTDKNNAAAAAAAAGGHHNTILHSDSNTDGSIRRSRVYAKYRA